MKYECLKLEERRIIEEMYAKGAKPGEIAERVGKCQATIYTASSSEARPGKRTPAFVKGIARR